mmetsp:Transcript_159077/g.510170  ORF Transcript_159077/g.510170 Transcript_159077/m.510170 type:complete len:262 (-) Transcript_159077:492-1277(-)
MCMRSTASASLWGSTVPAVHWKRHLGLCMTSSISKLATARSSTQTRKPMERLLNPMVMLTFSTSTGWPGTVTSKAKVVRKARPWRSAKTPMFWSCASTVNPGLVFGPTPSISKLRILTEMFSLCTRVDSNCVTPRIWTTRSAQKWKRSFNIASRTIIGGYWSQYSSCSSGSAGASNEQGSNKTSPTKSAPCCAAAVPWSLTMSRRPSQSGSLTKMPIMPRSISLGMPPAPPATGEVPANSMSVTTKSATQFVMFIPPKGTG